MIRNKSRAGWFGASDTAAIMGNWNTKTFSRWWLTKLGVIEDRFTTPAMRTGTAYEHAILDHLGIRRRDRQIKIRQLRLRVNLDGETFTTVHEVKTHKGEAKVSKAYWQQAQVEMFATGKKLVMVFYRVTDEEYINFFLPIDDDRVTIIPIDYDIDWIVREYLPRLKYLAHCLRKRKTPNMAEFMEFYYAH